MNVARADVAEARASERNSGPVTSLRPSTSKKFPKRVVSQARYTKGAANTSVVTQPAIDSSGGVARR
jgi:hypothetical protein